MYMCKWFHQIVASSTQNAAFRPFNFLQILGYAKKRPMVVTIIGLFQINTLLTLKQNAVILISNLFNVMYYIPFVIFNKLPIILSHFWGHTVRYWWTIKSYLTDSTFTFLLRKHKTQPSYFS